MDNYISLSVLDKLIFILLIKAALMLLIEVVYPRTYITHVVVFHYGREKIVE